MKKKEPVTTVELSSLKDNSTFRYKNSWVTWQRIKDLGDGTFMCNSSKGRSIPIAGTKQVVKL